MTDTVLRWGKIQRAMPREEWAAISADSAPPGVYTPNMSREDMDAWKARLAGTRSGDPRVEIRKSLAGTQMLLVVRRDTLTMSLNGKAEFRPGDLGDFLTAISEARAALAAVKDDPCRN